MSDWELAETYESASGEVRWGRLGDDGAPPVVLLHGTPFSSYVWRSVARALAGRFRVYVWDMPGYGASARFTGQDVSLAAQGEVFAGLLAHWELTAPAVVAHDFGGTVALRAHLLHGAVYDRLALVDAVTITPWGSPFFRLAARHAEVFEQLPAHLHRALVREYIAGVSRPGLHPATLDRLVEPWLGENGQPAFYRQIAQADERHTEQAMARYGEIAIPVLVCWGTDDAWLPPSQALDLLSLIPGARLQLIEGAGHLVQEDTPAELTAALLGFLNGGS
jgi:pimeloyl-ACP methyl ester carboxylesterase